MRKVTFYNSDTTAEDRFTIAIVACRIKGQWVFCKKDDLWHFPVAQLADGETVEDAAKRALADLPGIRCAEINTTRAFSFETDTDRHCGMLYLADLDAIEASESVGVFDRLPSALAYPAIASNLFSGLQTWLNLRCGADEMWDIYDRDRRPTGRLHRRGDFIPPGDYHIVVQAWLMNSKGEFLLTKRTPNKGYPNMWETTGGSAIAGDDSQSAVLREIREETGLNADLACGECVISFRADTCFLDVWLFHQDFDLADVVLQEGETCDTMYASKEKVRELVANGQFVPCSYLDKLFDIVK